MQWTGTFQMEVVYSAVYLHESPNVIQFTFFSYFAEATNISMKFACSEFSLIMFSLENLSAL